MDPELQKTFALLFVFLLATGPTCVSADTLKAVASGDMEIRSSAKIQLKAILSRATDIVKTSIKLYKVVKVSTWLRNGLAFLRGKPNLGDILPWVYENPPPIFDFFDILLSFSGIDVGKAVSTGYEVIKNGWWTLRFAAFLWEKPSSTWNVVEWLIKNPPPCIVLLAEKIGRQLIGLAEKIGPWLISLAQEINPQVTDKALVIYMVDSYSLR